MTRFWLVRHGETNWNVEGRYQGTTDIPLNDRGKSQAESLGQLLAANGVPFQAVFSSQLSRARETAGIIAGFLDLPVFVDKRLQEIDLGEWEGELFTEIREQFPERVMERLTNAAAPAPLEENLPLKWRSVWLRQPMTLPPAIPGRMSSW